MKPLPEPTAAEPRPTPLLGHVMLDLIACLNDAARPLTVAEVKALRTAYSDEIVRRALSALVNVGELQVVIVYDRRPGPAPRRYARTGGGLESLAPAAARPEPQLARPTGSSGVSDP